MIPYKCNPPYYDDDLFNYVENNPSYSGIILSLNTSMFNFCTHISPESSSPLNLSYTCTSGNLFNPSYNNCPQTWNPPGGRVIPIRVLPEENVGMYIGKPIKIKITNLIWPTDWHREVFLTDPKDNMSIAGEDRGYVLWERYEDDVYTNDHRVREGVIQDKTKKEYSLSTSIRAYYSVRIVGNLIQVETVNAKPADLDKSVEEYLPPGTPVEFYNSSVRYATKPTYFHIIEAAPATIQSVDIGTGVTIYDADTETYTASIVATLAMGGSWSPYYGDYNTYPSFAPHTVGVFDETTTTVSKTFTRSTSTSTNDDKLHYTIQDILPGRYSVGVTDNNKRTTLYNDLITILDGTIIFTLLDTFAPRTSYPQNRSTYTYTNNLYGTFFVQ